MAIADYCQGMERNEIRVNRDYQRSDRVWPSSARSFLIETILLGFPMPKLALFQVTDLKTRKVIKEIVDGQQRSMAIFDFYKGKYRLSSSLDSEDIRGKPYSRLSPEYQQRFLDYALSIDLFVATTLDEVREVFRRINSYTVPLNPEEQRHAVFQGAFKWFVHRFTRKYAETFTRIGMFTEKQLVRMQDTKLVTDVVRALLRGIETTKSSDLDAVYREFDEEFPEEDRIDAQLTSAFDQLLAWKDLHHTPVLKPNQAMPFILALVHMQHQIATLESIYHSTKLKAFKESVSIPRLSALADALEEDVEDAPRKLWAFATASESKTNVREARQTRFKTYCWALDPTSK